MYVKIVDGVPVQYNIATLRRENPQVSFPANPPKELLAEFGVYEAEVADEAPSRFHTESRKLALVSNGRALISREWDVTPLADAKARAVSILSDIRRRKIDAGFDFGGVTVPCDAESQRVYTAAYVLANDFPDMTRKWKMPTGFVELNADQIKAMAKAASDYVQSCFDAQAVQAAAVEAAKTVEEIEAVLSAAE